MGDACAESARGTHPATFSRRQPFHRRFHIVRSIAWATGLGLPSTTALQAMTVLALCLQWIQRTPSPMYVPRAGCTAQSTLGCAKEV